MNVRFFRITTILTLVMPVLLACARQEQTSGTLTFASPEDAVTALASAAEKNDVVALRQLFGPGTEALLSSGDDVQDRLARDTFMKRYYVRHQLVSGDANDMMLHVGDDNWPLPIPLVRENERWHFDGAAGAEKIVRQRIGANELHTIDVMRGYVGAQKEYAAKSHDGEPAGVYAQRLRSDPGKQNGLYWEVAAGQPSSPAGPFLAAATAEGYGVGQGAPYHGYLYRQLLSQGKDSQGGARDYMTDGKLKKGFALIAYPADYGSSGIMSFIVNQDGVVWQADLGEDTAAAVSAIQQFNPDSKWTPIPDEG